MLFKKLKNYNMKNLIKMFLLIAMFNLCSNHANAQVDPHYTQYYVYPSWLNPALTGVFDGNIRVSGIYRSQWGNVSSPFSTPGVSVDVNTDKNLNLGASILRQTAGDGGYTYTTAYGNFAYTGVKFGAAQMQHLVFGIQAGFIQRRFDRSKMTFGDQWNPVTGYNPGATSADAFSKNSATSFDAGAGVLFYDAEPGKKANIFAGLALSHITKPIDQFSATGDAVLPMRFTGHLGVRLAITDNFSITPNALYLKQGTAEEKMIGAYGQFRAAPGTDLLLGVNYRLEDAVSPYIGFSHRNLVLGISYDVNTSDLGKLANGANSFEVSLSFIGRRSAKTPEAEFICPRL